MPPRFSPPQDLQDFQGYIFDCDGTLADTMALHHKAWRQALAEGGAHFDFTWEVFLSRAGMSMERTVLELNQQFTQALDPAGVSARQRELFFQLEGKLEPVSEVLAFAQRVSKLAPLSVASGSFRPCVERTLHRIGAQHLFEIIITPEDVTHGKPDPEMFLLAAQRMRVAPEACLVIEDGALGIEAARRAGMQYVIVEGPQM
jgi:beta-phosphoglucomutase-like phosphatase (HAD superfamily)